MDMTRRDLVKNSAKMTAVALATGLAGSSCSSGANLLQEYNGVKPFRKLKSFKSSDFYNSDGSFNAEKAKKAYFDMFHAYNYAVSEMLKTDEFWVCDFLQKDFSTLGMGGIFWLNKTGKYGEKTDYKGDYKGQAFGYLGHEIYLLPGQMLPEHHHIGGPEGYGPKMEAWQVRYGSIELFGEYKDDDEKPVTGLKNKPFGYGSDWFKSKYAATRKAGEGLYQLGTAESWHFMRAGENGAIVSEYATYHNHVAFSKPGMKFDNTKAAKS